MKNKMFLLLCLVTLAAIALGACQPAPATPTASPPAATQAPEEPPATQAAEPAEPTATQPPPPAEPVHLVFWHQYDKRNAELIDEFVAEFNQQHPEIQVEAVIQPSYDEYKTLIQTSILAGTTPDLASVDLIWVPGMVASNALASLDEFIGADSQFDLDDFYSSLVEYDVIEGKRYALPMSANNMQVIYNKDLFAQAGLDPDKPPKTWDEMKAMAETCSDPDNGIVGFEFYTQPTGEGITWQFQVWLWAAGGEFLNEENTQAAFNSPEGLKALSFVTEMLQGHGSVPGPWGAFENNKACMQLDGSWLFGYRTGAPFEWDIALVPAPEGGTSATNVGGERLVMFGNSANQEAAWEFMKFLTSKEIQLRWDMETGFMPILKSVGEDPAYLEWAQESEPRMLPFIEGMTYAHTRPATPLYNQISDAFSREIQRAYVGEATPEEALAAAEQAVNEILSSSQ